MTKHIRRYRPITAARLRKSFGFDQIDSDFFARRFHRLERIDQDAYKTPPSRLVNFPSLIEFALNEASERMGARGVRIYREPNLNLLYWEDSRLLYVDTGDMSADTIIYDTDVKEFIIASLDRLISR